MARNTTSPTIVFLATMLYLAALKPAPPSQQYATESLRAGYKSDAPPVDLNPFTVTQGLDSSMLVTTTASGFWIEPR